MTNQSTTASTTQLIEELRERVVQALYVDQNHLLGEELLDELVDLIATKSAEVAKAEFEDRDIEVELDTRQCLEVTKMVFDKYEEAMKPPVFAAYTFKDWLNRQLTQPKENHD